MADSCLSEISSESVRSALLETIEKELKTKNVKIDLSAAAKQGDNFIGIVHRVSFSKKDDEKTQHGEKSESKLILKLAPTNEARRDAFMSRDCFLREMYLYNDVLPFFKTFQESRGIIFEEDGFCQYPNCYRTLDVAPDECLVIEDLSVKGFSMIDRRREEITADHVKLIVKSLGKFHAISFALRDQQPEKLKEISSNTTEIFFNHFGKRPEMAEYFESLKQNVFDSLASEEDKHLLEKMQKLFVKKQFDIAEECIQGAAAEPYAAICHGDCWSNNTMFRYDASGKPIEVSLIDWQITRYASPVNDLLYYIFCCTEKDLRDVHYDSFLKTYHESLSDHLRKLGSDPEKLFPFDAMLDQFHKFGRFGLVMAMALLPMLTCEEGTSIDLDDMAEKVKDGEKLDQDAFITDSSRKVFHKRLRGVVQDMVRLGYVD